MTKKEEIGAHPPMMQDKQALFDLIRSPDLAPAVFADWRTQFWTMTPAERKISPSEIERSNVDYIVLYGWDLDSKDQHRGRFGYVGFTAEGQLVSIYIAGNFEGSHYYRKDGKWYSYGYFANEGKTMEKEVEEGRILTNLSYLSIIEN